MKEETYQADKNARNGTSSVQLIPQHHIVESVPFLRLDSPDDWIAIPFFGNLTAGGNGHQKTVLGTFKVYLLGDLAGCFPFFGADVVFNPFADNISEMAVGVFVVWGWSAVVPGWFGPRKGAAEGIGTHIQTILVGILLLYVGKLYHERRV